MKSTSAKILFTVILSAFVFNFSNADILAAIPIGYIAAALAAVGILALFMMEYSRERAPIKLPRRFYRSGTLRPHGAGAYGIRRRRAIVHSIAARPSAQHFHRHIQWRAGS